jgi:hypothetical protein
MAIKKKLLNLSFPLSLFMLNEVLRNCYDSISLFLRLIVRRLKDIEQFPAKPLLSLAFLGRLV